MAHRTTGKGEQTQLRGAQGDSGAPRSRGLCSSGPRAVWQRAGELLRRPVPSLKDVGAQSSRGRQVTAKEQEGPRSQDKWIQLGTHSQWQRPLKGVAISTLRPLAGRAALSALVSRPVTGATVLKLLCSVEKPSPREEGGRLPSGGHSLRFNSEEARGRAECGGQDTATYRASPSPLARGVASGHRLPGLRAAVAPWAQAASSPWAAPLPWRQGCAGEEAAGECETVEERAREKSAGHQRARGEAV